MPSTCEPWLFGWDQTFALIQAVGVVAGTGIAIWGIVKWRTEQVGRRQAELAEEALALAFEAQEVFDRIRSPFSFVGEGGSRQKTEPESQDESRRRDMQYVPFERLDTHRDFFLRVQRLRPKFMAMFGRRSAEPLSDIRVLRKDVLLAAEISAGLSDDLVNATKEDWDELRSTKKENDVIKWKGKIKPDQIDQRLSKLTQQLEQQLEPLLKSRYRGRS